MFLGLALLSACGPQTRPPPGEVLLPLPPQVIDPDDRLARETVRDMLQTTGAPVASTYSLHRHDLNDDGRREALVLFKTPYGYWCDRHGCTMLVLKAANEGFTLIGDVQPVREPVFISALKNNGWKNLVIRVSGRWEQSKDVALLFDGERYPENPGALPPYLRYASNDEKRIFYD